MIFAGLELARRIEAAETTAAIECTWAGGTAQAAAERIGGGCAVFAGIGSPLTHALGLGMQGPVAAAELDAIEKFFGERGSPVMIDLCPLADPSLVELLGQRGYRVAEFNNVLARETGGAIPPATAIAVREASACEMDLWAATVGRGFFEEESLSEEQMDVGRTIFRMPGTRCFLAFTGEGEPAGGAALAVHDRTAILLADSTLPRARRAGVHTALIRSRLEAVASATDVATASTLPGSISQRNYERMGFRVVYTRVVLTADRPSGATLTGSGCSGPARNSL